jgi:DNA invertase Pin-like site-specific DNA recombinase
MKGARTSVKVLTDKYQNVNDLLDKSELSIRRIARITGHSINTVRKIKQLKEI